jgi:hypothetical protein
LAADRLYLKDGSYQLVREYQVQNDRVRYFSSERDDWEEIPLDLVDLEKTKKEVSERTADRAAQDKADAEERAAAKALSQQVRNAPPEPGVYWIVNDDGKLETLTRADMKIVNDKKRSVLKALSPIPIVPGKSTVELDGLQAQHKVPSGRPEFFIRLSAEERFELIRLSLKKDARVAENLSILVLQGEKMVDEQVQIVPAFKKQEDGDLYRIWPQKALEPGEYAVIQYTEGKMSPQVWDFSVVK